MSLLGLTAVGFLLGVRHALEADHLAAVASLSTRARSIGDGLKLGVLWGIGHTVTLFVFGSAVLLLDVLIPERLASGLELAVGVMLLVLGADVLWRGLRSHLHWHRHRHRDGTVHLHAHTHADRPGHDHPHPRRGPWRALLVGLMHGMAGSAALILLTLEAAPTLVSGILYILLFGLGSIGGMVLLSAVMVAPMRLSGLFDRRFAGLHRGMEVVIGVVTIAIGVVVILKTSGLQEMLR